MNSDMPSTLRVQDAIEALTDAEKRELDTFAQKLRRFAAGDVLAELEHHDAELVRLGKWLGDETLDDETPDYVAYLVNDHRRRREMCGRELTRRNHENKLPSGGARSPITRELIDGIKHRVNLAELMLERGVDLKIRGSKANGCCPFHEDKKPSLSVNQALGVWYCFGCGAGGDALQFVMQFDSLDFVPALQVLAERAGMELPTPRFEQKASQNENLDGNAPQTHAENYLPLDTILDAFRRAETGDAEILAQMFADKITYDHAERSWYIFREHAWTRDETGRVEKFVTDQVAAQYLFAAAETKRREGEGEAAAKRYKDLYARANALCYRSKIANVLDRARKQETLALVGNEWDRDAFLLGVANGVINLRMREFAFRDGTPRDFIRTVAPTQWRTSDEPAPRFEQFLREIFAGDDELISFVQRLFGYGITGATSEHVFPVLWGSGRNGKDTLLETLKFVLGDCAAPVQSEVLLSSARDANAATPHLYALRGKRLCWVNESSEGARFNTSQLKMLTGGGTIVARPLYGSPIIFSPQYLLMLVTNHKPRANPDDYALWKRLLLVPFTQAFVESPRASNEHRRDTTLAETLRAESSGILAWLVRGCLEWQRSGLNPPASVRTATEAYQAEQDTLADFISACCVCQPQAETRAFEFYSAYRRWAVDNGFTPLDNKMFGQRMTQRYEKKRTEGGFVYFGIGLLNM